MVTSVFCCCNLCKHTSICTRCLLLWLILIVIAIYIASYIAMHFLRELLAFSIYCAHTYTHVAISTYIYILQKNSLYYCLLYTYVRTYMHHIATAQIYITDLIVGTGLLCLLFYPLCYAAVLKDLTYYAQNYAQE